MKGPPRIGLTALLFAVWCGPLSCIATYHPNLQEASFDQNLTRSGEPIWVYYSPGLHSSEEPSPDEMQRSLAVFAALGFRPQLASAPPNRGPFLRVSLASATHPDQGSILCEIFRAFLMVLPCYQVVQPYEMNFDLYLNGVLKKKYRYPIARYELNWIVLVPFMWLNWFMTSTEEAIHATVRLCVRDAITDGLL